LDNLAGRAFELEVAFGGALPELVETARARALVEPWLAPGGRLRTVYD